MDDTKWTEILDAAEARAGGRIVTGKIVHLLAEADRGAYWPDMRSVLQGEPRYATAGASMTRSPGDRIPSNVTHFGDPAEALAWIWDTHLLPRHELKYAAQSASNPHQPVPSEAEAIAGWPIMRAREIRLARAAEELVLCIENGDPDFGQRLDALRQAL